MTIVIAGGTGFLGRSLAAALAADGHDVYVLSRRAGIGVPAGVRLIVWNLDRDSPALAAVLHGADAVINLAGEPIAAGRWTAVRKRRIEESRVATTSALVAAMAGAHAPPAVLVNGSAVGFYGPLGSELVTEETGAGHDFLATVCRRWEAQAVAAAAAGTRVVCLRTGLVLERDGGALARMLLPFRAGAGGRLGSGEQYWAWIHRHDWIDLVRFALTNDRVTGPLNATAPAPVTNREFTAALGRALHRPTVLPVPAVALRAIFGEMADVVLTGQRAVPARAEQLGFRFKYRTIDAAFASLFDRG